MSENNCDQNVGFNWGSLVTTLLPTVGTVIGQLLGNKSANDGVLCYMFTQTGQNEEPDAGYFFAEDGDYYFLNCSKGAGKRVSITFPAIMPNLGPETVLVNGNGGRAKVTAAFSKTASSDNSHIEITAGGGSTVSADLGADDSFQVACSGNRVPVDGNFHDIGSYLQVALNGSNITLKGIESKIKSIASLSVKGSGDTETRLMNAPPQAETEVFLSLPEPLPDNSLVDIKFVGKISAGANAVRACQAEMSVASDALIEQVKNAPRLNWR
ncbi:MAG: hypothetical protein RR115_00400 [Hydrogenoanaerobacterium sp.]